VTFENAYNRVRKTGYHGNLEEALALAMLPTPTSPRPHDSEETAGKYYKSQNQRDLTYHIGMLPTPLTISDNPAAHGKTNGEWQTKINKMLPTPHGNCSTGPGTQGREGGENIQTTIGANCGLKLQPAFVEWMLGFPEGWTELTD